MGVPAFFRWLSRKYVSIIVDAVEERRREHDGVKIPVNCTEPNPNFQEFDNLYLDMNGIIHPCTHPEDRPAPKTEEEMFILIFEYIDRLFSIVRPRKLLYMAIDGVAPRAKMNQQRSRRFRASKEAAEKLEQIANIRKKLEDEGIPLPPPRKKEEQFDSNCITPGTPFMARLSTALRYYIHKRITYEPSWQKIQVILSDANVPGEGEHKIMDYIRRQRASPEHNPNTVHCLCGADADLIMLGLATHEANFNIIREEFVPNQPKPCELCGQYGHELEHCQGLARAEAGPDQADPLKKEKNFIFIRLPVLREYLERELFMPNLPIPFDLERAIDDWVMMCFFVGNDFLPHLPSLEIRENAIDRLIKLYKNIIYQAGGWLTNDGQVNIERVKLIMIELGKAEDEIFRERQLRELRFKDSQKQRNQRAKEAAALIMPYNARLIAPQPICAKPEYISGTKIREMAADDRKQLSKDVVEQQARKLKSLLQPVNITQSLLGSKRKAEQKLASESPTGSPPAKSFKDEKSEKTEETVGPKPTIVMTTPSGKKTPLARGVVGALVSGDNESEEEPEDEIRLWEAGWKDRYYQAKFQVPESDFEFRKKVVCAYIEGLSWVLRYYYQGCASWTWFYPFHYAPFASDFELIGNFQPDFSKPTKPFKPLEQLMGVFPAASRAHIPESWRWLMTDEKSPIIDFYPEDFEIDLNGKKYAWQGVALLPFVDEKRLLDALDLVYDKLNSEEKARNTTGPDRLFIGKHHELFDLVHEVHTQGKPISIKANEEKIDDLEKEKEENLNIINEHNQNSEENNDGLIDDENIVKEKESFDTITENECEHYANEDDHKSFAKCANGNTYDEKHWILIDATKAFGMSGEVSHDTTALAYGGSHASLFKNSLEFGDIKNNTCIMVEFRDPQFSADFCFKASRLQGITEVPKVLKPGDYDERRQGKFRPQIGFSRDIPHASISLPGRRTLNHHLNEQHRSQHSRRSGPAALNYYQHQQQTTPSQQPHNQQQLPWHIDHSFAPQTTQMSNLTPMPLNFMQMALPPPPTPPQSWITQQSQQVGGGYVAQWGQPPVFTPQQQQYHQQQQSQQIDNSWRRQNQWSPANRYQQQQNVPYYRNNSQSQQRPYNNNGGNNRNQQWQQQSHSAPRESRTRNPRH